MWMIDVVDVWYCTSFCRIILLDILDSHLTHLEQQIHVTIIVMWNLINIMLDNPSFGLQWPYQSFYTTSKSINWCCNEQLESDELWSIPWHRVLSNDTPLGFASAIPKVNNHINF
jgi:hypothetical protein